MSDLLAAIERARTGDLAAFEEVYRALSGPLLSYLRTRVRAREDAEDLLAQVFLEAMRGVGRFRGGVAEFRAWLFRIGRDRAIDLARRAARRPEDSLDAATGRPSAETTDAQALAMIERERVWQAVAALPEAQREVIALRLASGLSGAEIAAVLGKGINAIKALQHRALQNLARTLGTELDEPGATGTSGRGGGIPGHPGPALSSSSEDAHA